MTKRDSELAHRMKEQWSRVQSRAAELEKRAKDSLNLGDVPEQLRGAWDKVLGQIRTALDYAKSEDVQKLAKEVDDLGRKVDKLMALERSEKHKPDKRSR